MTTSKLLSAALIAAVLCFGITLRTGITGLRDGHVWLWAALPRAAPAVALGAAVTAAAIGVIWGTQAAGGPDSSCYLHQAEMFARGELRERQPLAAKAPWPHASSTFVPIAFVLPAAERAMVPACPSGFPMVAGRGSYARRPPGHVLVVSLRSRG